MKIKTKIYSRLTVALIFLFSVSLAQAQINKHVPYKQSAIFGSVLTWIYAAVVDAPIRNCEYVGNNARLEYGVDSELSLKTIGFFNHDCTLHEFETWRLSYKPLINFSNWKGDSSSEFSRSAYDIAIIPMIRWEKSFDFTQKLVDFEMGVGFSYVSETNIGSRKKSTNFQFTDHFGVGISNPKQDWRVSFAFRHLSNASIKLPNNGVNLFGAAIEFNIN